jgi:two-component system sensor histidine kinase CpxA
MYLALALMRRQSAQKDSPALERIERETSKLSNLVQQLLLLARMEAGSLPAETLSAVSILTLCEGIIEDANFEAVHANCQVTGSRQDVTLLAYPQLLRRAIDNVLRNAIRHAPPGTEIILNARVDSDLQQVIFEIVDSGPGVPKSMLTDIFRPFFRTSPRRETKSGGAGLGLAIASEAVHLHNGTITAENRDTVGLCVTIRLPLRLPMSQCEPQSLATGASASQAVADSRVDAFTKL